MFGNILVVCVGNICRSPTAEVLLRARLQGAGTQVHSAGLGALVGQPIEPTALALLAEHGHDGSGHRARQLDAEMLRQADLVLAMEPGHVERILALAPHVRGRVMLLGKWLDERAISDPYRQQREAFEHAYTLIERAVDGWLPYL